MAVVQNYLPGDPLLIDKIVYELKSQGIFDQFRKECIADVDTKPAYQNLRQRVEGSVSGFLNKQKWSPDMNKNQLREMLRKNIYESGFLETGVERIVDQVVNPKINSIFLPKVTEIVYKFLGIEKNPADNKNLIIKLESTNDNLLPTDLEAVSPESEKRFNISNNSSQNLDDSKIDEDESPPFEPLEEKPVYTIAPEENSMDSHLSGFSGLMSHDSNHSQEISKTTQMEVSNQDSTISKQSSEGRLSIVMSDDNDTKMEVCDDSSQQKAQTKSFNFQSDVPNNSSGGKKPDKTSKKDDKHKSKHDKDGKRDDKDSRSRSEKDQRKEHKSSSKDKSSKEKERERKDSSKSGRSDRSKSDSRHSTSTRDKDKGSSSSKSSSSKDRPKSSSSSKNKDDKTKHTSSKHESRSEKHKKDDKHHRSDRHSSSSSKNRDKKEQKKDKKENKDDHFSSKKRTDRRSTDRDSNDGHSGLKSSSSSFDSYSSSQTQGKSQESSNSNSNNGSGGDSNSDCVEGITTALGGLAPLKLIKPKFASNIHEARRLMKIRKQISLLEKQNLLNAAKLITQKLIENKKKSEERKEPSPPPLSPPLKSSIVSAATWDALEAKLHESINYTTRYDGLENDEEVVVQNKEDCLYLKNEDSEKVQRYRKFASEYISNLESSIEGSNSKKPSIRRDIIEEKGVKRKFVDYSSDIKNNNNNKRFNIHHIEVHENFSLPLSPAESDNSIDKKSDVSDSSDKAVKKIETDLVVKRTNRGGSNNQRYSSEELYKPRLVFGGSRRRKGRNVGLD